ncbi:MAG: ABC transporter substrate-binding protein [Bacteroidales bacterium]|nr:ABC transporter substrate-binding protein [Bacteroidales bacterium]
MKKFLLLSILLIMLGSCSGHGNGSLSEDTQGDTLTLYSSLLTMVERPDGAIGVTIENPWKEGTRLQHLLLVHRDSTFPDNTDATVVRIPLERAGVYSSVHTGGLKELDALSVIAGVADVAYFPQNDTIRTLVQNGLIADLGSSQSPTVERIAASELQAVLRSPMEGLGAGTLPAGVVPLEMADYMETSPLGRAEWILLLGALTDRLPQAQALLNQVVEDYSDLHYKATMAQSAKPSVLTETEQSGVWYVPGGHSYMARFITDAGGTLPWEDNSSTGSVPMGLEAVAARALEADVWILKTFGSSPGAEDLVKMNPRYAAFKPVRNRNIWSCNTAQVPFFDDIAFHPERLLADYIAIFHPEVLPEHKMNYFQKSK